MRIEVDQSGRVERLNTKTVIGGSNGESQTVIISAGTKQRLFQQLRKTLFPAKELPVILFSVLVYLLLRRFKKLPTIVEIDEEYSGKSDIIEETIIKLYQRENQRFPNIRFTQIGKRSNAHQISWKTHRLKRNDPKNIIREKDILNLWKSKSRS